MSVVGRYGTTSNHSDLSDLSLTFDHRVANGSGAAAFLNAIDRAWRGDTA